MEPSRPQPEHQASHPLTRADVLSASEVAELLGIPRSTVHHLETKRSTKRTDDRPAVATPTS